MGTPPLREIKMLSPCLTKTPLALYNNRYKYGDNTDTRIDEDKTRYKTTICA